MVYQCAFVIYPEHPLDFNILGPDLRAAHANVSLLLWTHLVLQSALAAALVLALHKAGHWTRCMGTVLGCMRTAWLLVSLRAASIWTVRQYTVVFVTLFSLSNFLIVSTPFNTFVVFYVLTHLIYMLMLAGQGMSAAFVLRMLSTSVSIWMFNLWTEDAKVLNFLSSCTLMVDDVYSL